jgi:putative transposase
MQKQSRTREAKDQPQRTVSIGPVPIDARMTLLELAVTTGLTVLRQMLEEDRAVLCGVRYAHLQGRRAHRAGTTPSAVVLGGRTVAMPRPRVRAGGREVALPTWTAVATRDPLTKRAVQQMLLGVATRGYAASLEPIAAGVVSRGTSKSAVSRRFVACTRAQLETWRTRAVGELDLAVLMLDGVRFAHECLVVALGIDTQGRKHVLGLWEGATENATVCQALLTNLVERGLRTDRSVLVILDGSKALYKAVTETFGAAAWIQRCQVHKARNVRDYLPKAQQAWVRDAMRRALRSETRPEARHQLEALARRVEARYPQAAASIREGLEEVVTVLDLPVHGLLRRALATTNTIESLIQRVRHVHRNVKRWHGRSMALRWAAAGVITATAGFKLVKGARDMRALVNRLRARDGELKLAGAACAA